MIKNRTIQLIYLSAACALGIIGVLASVGFFEYFYRWDFYIYFTNISNYFCIIILFIELIHTAKKKEDSYINTLPVLKFVGMMGILLTFIVFNFILGPGRKIKENFAIDSVILHVVLPIVYTLDWVLFYEKGKTNWKYPLYALSLPLAYLAYIIIHAAIHNFDHTIKSLNGYSSLIYPYFFIDFHKLGVVGVLEWMGIIALGMLAIGYLLYLVDKSLKIKTLKRNKIAK